jgi:hypothetical protein
LLQILSERHGHGSPVRSLSKGAIWFRRKHVQEGDTRVQGGMHATVHVGLLPASQSRRLSTLYKRILGLRGIEWAIFELRTRESWGLQGESAFQRGLEFGMYNGWHEHRNATGGFGTHIRSQAFAQSRLCAGFSVIRKRA